MHPNAISEAVLQPSAASTTAPTNTRLDGMLLAPKFDQLLSRTNAKIIANTLAEWQTVTL